MHHCSGPGVVPKHERNRLHGNARRAVIAKYTAISGGSICKALNISLARLVYLNKWGRQDLVGEAQQGRASRRAG